MKHLVLHDNGLVGAIPPDVVDLKGLQQLDLSLNHLSGPIPAELGQFSRLRELNLRDNQLAGKPPHELSTLANLERLMINSNLLAGPLPLEWTHLNLFMFTFQETLLCIPDNPAMQRWLDGIHNLESTGLICAVDPSQTYALALAADHLEARATPGASVQYTITVTNTGDGVDSFSISVDSNWPASASAVVGPLAAGASAEFAVAVEIPDQALAAAQDIAAVTAMSGGDKRVTETIELTTIAEQVADTSVDLYALVDSGAPGAQLSYVVGIQNLGNGVDSFTLAVQGAWEANLDVDETGPIEVGVASTHRMTVTVPADATSGATALIGVTATSAFDPQVNSSAWVTATAIISGGVTVESAEPHSTAPAGATALFPVVVTNQANYPALYTIETIGQWPVSLSDSSTGQLEPGAVFALSVSIAIPIDARLDDIDQTTLIVREGDLARAALVLTAVASQQAALSCAPMQQDAFGQPGEMVRYSVAVVNEGEGVDSFLFEAIGMWPAVLSHPQTAYLAPGASELVTVDVFIPADASVFDRDETVLTLTSHFDPTVEDHAIFTTMTPRQSYLPLVAR